MERIIDSIIVQSLSLLKMFLIHMNTLKHTGLHYSQYGVCSYIFELN